MNLKPLLGLSVAVLLASCGASSELAGTGVASETTNGLVIRGQVCDAASNGVPRARVELRSVASDSLASHANSDTNGNYELAAVQSGRYLLSSRDAGLGASRWLSLGPLVRESGAEPLLLRPQAPLRGKVSGSLPPLQGLMVHIQGTTRRTLVSTDSSWSIDSIAAGTYLAKLTDATGKLMAEQLASTNAESSLSYDTVASILIDDFEGLPTASRLHDLLDGAWWGMWNDTGATPATSRVWSGVNGNYNATAGAYSGHSLHAALKIGPSFAEAPGISRSAGLQVQLGGRDDLDPDGTWFPTAKVDSIVFMTKGSGTFRFEVKARMAGQSGTAGIFWTEFVLTPNWTRHAFSPRSLSAPAAMTWDTSRMHEFYWTTTDSSSEIWLDDIRLIGLHSSDLLH